MKLWDHGLWEKLLELSYNKCVHKFAINLPTSKWLKLPSGGAWTTLALRFLNPLKTEWKLYIYGICTCCCLLLVPAFLRLRFFPYPLFSRHMHVNLQSFYMPGKSKAQSKIILTRKRIAHTPWGSGQDPSSFSSWFSTFIPHTHFSPSRTTALWSSNINVYILVLRLLLKTFTTPNASKLKLKTETPRPTCTAISFFSSPIEGGVWA